MPTSNPIQNTGGLKGWKPQLGYVTPNYDPRMSLFTGDNAPSAEDVYRLFGHVTQQAGTDVYGLDNPFLKTQTLPDIEKTYGIRRDVSGVFNPMRTGMRQALATGRAKAMSSAATRQGYGTASPEAGMLPIEGQFAQAQGQAESGLNAAQGQAQLGQENFAGGFLKDILQLGPEMEMKKKALASQIMQSMMSGTQGFQGFQRGGESPTFSDYFMAILGAASQAAPALAAAPAAAPAPVP
jgi:hypothetical protein